MNLSIQALNLLIQAMAFQGDTGSQTLDMLTWGTVVVICTTVVAGIWRLCELRKY